MKYLRLFRHMRLALFFALAFALMGGFPALAQGPGLNLRVAKVTKKTITVRWDAVTPFATYDLSYRRSGSASEVPAGATTNTRWTLAGLSRNTAYTLKVNGSDGNVSSITVSTQDDEAEPSAYTPPPQTCLHLPSHVVISGQVEYTQCQMVGEIVLSGRPDLQARGFVDAVDIWHYVNGGLEVCFRYHGWLVLLDATYLQRMPMELEHHHREGMTCGEIDRIGTVVVLASGPSAATDATQPTEDTLPVFDAIPLHDCQIKLLETLFLRAEPAGEIIGIVWLNSEVPVFEINGYWYKVEFEGVTGYVSRYYRKVLSGGCG